MVYNQFYIIEGFVCAKLLHYYSTDLSHFKLFKLRKGASITHFVGQSVCMSVCRSVPKKCPKKFPFNCMHYFMDNPNPYISNFYMPYLMEDKEEEGEGERV